MSDDLSEVSVNISKNERLGLWANQEQAILLKRIEVKAQLKDFLAEVSVSQTFLNTENKCDDADFTFLLPTGAVLLSFIFWSEASVWIRKLR